MLRGVTGLRGVIGLSGVIGVGGVIGLSRVIEQGADTIRNIFLVSLSPIQVQERYKEGRKVYGRYKEESNASAFIKKEGREIQGRGEVI